MVGLMLVVVGGRTFGREVEAVVVGDAGGFASVGGFEFSKFGFGG